MHSENILRSDIFGGYDSDEACRGHISMAAVEAAANAAAAAQAVESLHFNPNLF